MVSISYRRIPETTLWHQIDDVMAALRYLGDNRTRLQLNLDQCYLTGALRERFSHCLRFL